MTTPEQPKSEKAFVFEFDPSLGWEQYCLWFDGKVSERPHGTAATHDLLDRINDMSLRERCIAIWAVYQARLSNIGFDASVDACQDTILELDRLDHERSRLAQALAVPESLLQELS